jgi:lysophospholipase L1-like esterase
VTVPLTKEKKGVRQWLREVKQSLSELVGKSPATPPANWKRKQFNELLKKEYEGKIPMFDLAQIESTFPDGSRQISVKQGKEFFSLVPDYTDDGGHLNELGRRVVGEKLLIFLAQL